MTYTLVLLLPTIIAAWLAMHLLLRRPRTTTLSVIGHRGAAGLAPENTLAAVSAGVEAGVRAIEVDVHRSADGELVVIHDAELGRTTNGSGRVTDLTWAALSELDAGSHFSAAFAGEPLPRLDEVLEMLKKNEMTLYLEVKQPTDYPGIGDQIRDALMRYEMADQTVVMSFDHDWLAVFHRQAPQIPVISLGVWLIRPPLAGEESAVGVLWRTVVIDPTFIWRMHRRSIQVSVWTVNQRWQMRLLKWMGVDAITTDRPDRAP